MCLQFTLDILLGFRAHCFDDQSGNDVFFARNYIQYEVRMNDLLHPIFSAFRREKWLAEADSIRMIFLTASIAAGVYYYLQCVAFFVAIHRHRIIKRIRGMRIALMAVNLTIPTSAVFQNCPVWGPTASVVGAFSIDTDSGFRPMDKSITTNAKGYFFPIGIVSVK